MIDIEKIKAAALAATQGEWGSYGPIVYLPHGLGGFNIHDCVNPYPNATHIALANPQTVLELITRLEAAEKDAARLDYLQGKLPESVIRLGDSWYWRTGYGKPHKKAQSLREAIDAAMKESA